MTAEMRMDRDEQGGRLVLDVMPGAYAICRCDPDQDVPAWAMAGDFFSVTRTPAELSIVCDAARVPPGVRAVGPWTALAVRGPLDFALTGVLAGLAAPLAAAGISLSAIATFDTDYVFVRTGDVDRAIGALRGAGHDVVDTRLG